MNNHTIREQLNLKTINKLNALRNLSSINLKKIKVLGILIKHAITSVKNIDTYLARDIAYGKSYADEIIKIRMMSKRELHSYAKKLRYVEGYKSDYFKKGSLTKEDWLNMKLHGYVMNRLVLSK